MRGATVSFNAALNARSGQRPSRATVLDAFGDVGLMIGGRDARTASPRKQIVDGIFDLDKRPLIRSSA